MGSKQQDLPVGDLRQQRNAWVSAWDQKCPELERVIESGLLQFSERAKNSREQQFYLQGLREWRQMRNSVQRQFKQWLSSSAWCVPTIPDSMAMATWQQEAEPLLQAAHSSLSELWGEVEAHWQNASDGISSKSSILTNYPFSLSRQSKVLANALLAEGFPEGLMFHWLALFLTIQPEALYHVLEALNLNFILPGQPTATDASEVEIISRRLSEVRSAEWIGQSIRQGYEQRHRDTATSTKLAQQAHHQVDQAIRELIARAGVVPALVQRLLLDHWHRVMLLVFMRHGQSSTEWQQHMVTAERLIWSVTKGPEQSEQLLAALPTLLRDLRAGLTLQGRTPYVGGDVFEINQLLDSLRQLHRDRMMGVPLSALSVQPSPQANAPSTPAAKILDADELKAQVEMLTSGDWFEFRNPGERPQRWRLSAAIKESDRYIFVDGMGVKVAEHTAQSLMNEMRDENLVVLDQGGGYRDSAISSLLSRQR